MSQFNMSIFKARNSAPSFKNSNILITFCSQDFVSEKFVSVGRHLIGVGHFTLSVRRSDGHY